MSCQARVATPSTSPSPPSIGHVTSLPSVETMSNSSELPSSADFKTVTPERQPYASAASGAADVHSGNAERPETAHRNKTERVKTVRKSGVKIQAVSGRRSF